jgi:hypothetical protein
MSLTAWPDPASPNAIASANGGRVRAPGDQRVEAEVRAAGAADPLLRGSHRLDGRADEPRVEIGGDLRQGMARCRSQPERLRHRHGPVDEPIVLRHEGHRKAIADESSQGEQRLQARHAAANDYDPAGDRPLA